MKRNLYATSVRVLAVFTFAAGALVLAAGGCTRGGDATRRTATVSAYYELKSMNPLATSGDLNLALERYALFTPLVKYDSSLHVVPWLAQSWDTTRVGADSIDLTFHLRNGVHWHDGVNVTSADVAYTFNLARDPRTAYSNAQTFGLYSPHVDVLDSTTVRFRLRAHPDFLEAWFLTPPLPSHLLKDVKPEEFARAAFGLNPVGSGPFKFVRHDANGTWVFDANDSFPAAMGGRPRIDRLVYRAIPEQTSVITSLLAGDIDLAISIRPSNVKTLEADHNVYLVRYPIPNWIFVAFNTRTRFFDTPEERRAIALAADRRAIIDVIMGGANPVGRGTVTPVHSAFDSANASLVIPYNPDSARVLLARAGWRDANHDGVLEDARGRPFRFRMKAWQSSGAYGTSCRRCRRSCGA